MNNVSLVGRITKNIELKYTPNGIATATFNLAVNRDFKNQNGEREADFIRVVAWRKTAELLNQYCYQGSRIGLQGRIQTRNFDDQNGQRVYITEVVANSIEFLESRRRDEQPYQNEQQPYNNDQQPYQYQQQPYNNTQSTQDNQDNPFS